jgi:hypothetical protein
MPDSFLEFSPSPVRRVRVSATPILESEALVKVRAAYQREGRLAAAAAARNHNPALSLSEALYLVDQVLGLRKGSAFP